MSAHAPPLPPPPPVPGCGHGAAAGRAPLAARQGAQERGGHPRGQSGSRSRPLPAHRRLGAQAGCSPDWQCGTSLAPAPGVRAQNRLPRGRREARRDPHSNAGGPAPHAPRVLGSQPRVSTGRGGENLPARTLPVSPGLKTLRAPPPRPPRCIYLKRKKKKKGPKKKSERVCAPSPALLLLTHKVCGRGDGEQNGCTYVKERMQQAQIFSKTPHFLWEEELADNPPSTRKVFA